MSLREKIRVRYGYLELFFGVLIALIAALGVWWWMSQFVAEKDLLSVVVATRSVVAPRTLAQDDVKMASVPRTLFPEGAVATTTLAIGQVLTRSVAKNQIITTADIIYNRDPASEATLVPPGKVGLVMASNWLTAPLPRVKKNDALTFYVSAPFNVPNGARGVLFKNALVLGVSTDKDGVPYAVFLALPSSAVEALLAARANQYPLVAVAESGQAGEVVRSGAATSSLR